MTNNSHVCKTEIHSVFKKKHLFKKPSVKIGPIDRKMMPIDKGMVYFLRSIVRNKKKIQNRPKLSFYLIAGRCGHQFLSNCTIFYD